MKYSLLNVFTLLAFANAGREEALRMNHVGQPTWAIVSGVWCGLLFAGAVLYYGSTLAHAQRHPSSLFLT